ncbi:hypothetical protein O181_036214 [Austropuccinia psidii MF-1]|uniref:Uncharacterized protein n=1 Tax=Austropuccinia psidii MF-1 TaxID=1389203 RepID=A0A9Q3D479_9BASI|nr:hypothetical protein [Austropuccinia psidii MF-1]
MYVTTMGKPLPNWCLWQVKPPPMHGQLAILSILGHSTTHGMEWCMVIHGPKPQMWSSGHILLHWHFWPISNLTNPPENTPKFGSEGVIQSSRGLWPH